VLNELVSLQTVG